MVTQANKIIPTTKFCSSEFRKPRVQRSLLLFNYNFYGCNGIPFCCCEKYNDNIGKNRIIRWKATSFMIVHLRG